MHIDDINGFDRFDSKGNGYIEAYFHGKLAQMKGHRQMGNFLSQVRVAWRQSGYRNEKDLLHSEFGPLESSIGRAMIRIESRHEAEMGLAALNELAEAGNDIARDYLAARGGLEYGRVLRESSDAYVSCATRQIEREGKFSD